ncbi:GlxA family transcriptional regulator [Acuticoccus sp. I52.16.1]|uniref:GlxA family transcriptional regulator n=1 Tax=Acuticoccus sp. I52.16.1 TaxID=2928472 RepID=UPI001FD50D8E|nr:GlxA family transcriptional regulator [Acuticoccus sp. I52.16.1]UOM34994.1 GlxA family transcriptional regulator [Acuticoccus sp. I52.16.1]
MTAPRLSVGFLLTRRFTLCAFANFVDVLRLAADEGDRSRPILCRWSILSATMEPVRSSCGLAVQPDARLGDPARFDYIVVVGGLIDEMDGLDAAAIAFLREAAGAGVPLVGVCTGAFVLHAAGLMQGYRCCVSWFHRDDFLDRFDGLEPVADRIFVVDRDRLTCSGGVSAAHLAAYLVDMHVGRAAARKSLSIMIIDEALPADRAQPSATVDLKTSDQLVRRALGLMRETMAAPIPVTVLADRLGVSRRRLERHFQATLGLTPHEAARKVRLGQAKALLASTDRSITAIAAETGFCDASHLIRVFRAEEATTPEAWRRQAVAGVAS